MTIRAAIAAAAVLLIPSAAFADDAAATSPAAPADDAAAERAPQPTASLEYPRIGGHVGVAVPYLEVAKQTSLVGQNDFLTIANPIGLTGKLSKKWAVDFEFIILTSVLGKSSTKLLVDPGVIYNWGPVATGLRVAYQVGEPANVGAIPLINKGFSLGSVTWFIEAAFPTFVKQGDVTFNAVLHTGLAF